MKFVIRKAVEQEWMSCHHIVSHYEDKIYLKSYTYQDALKKISIIYEDIEERYKGLYTREYITICKWNISVMLVPVSEKFKGQNNWINTKNFLKYKG